MPPNEGPDPEELRREQETRERQERRRLEEAVSPEEEREADRRAEKAAYLKEKLDEQVGKDSAASGPADD